MALFGDSAHLHTLQQTASPVKDQDVLSFVGADCACVRPISTAVLI
jgi:hypothetical protein